MLVELQELFYSCGIITFFFIQISELVGIKSFKYRKMTYEQWTKLYKSMKEVEK